MIVFSSVIPTIGLGSLSENFDQKLLGTNKVYYIH
jgi:hypothetical protein